MKGRMPDWRVSTVVNDPDSGKDRWTNVGVAFKNNETITNITLFIINLLS
jgi:hypothetical protein